MPIQVNATNFLLKQRNWMFTNEIMYFSHAILMQKNDKKTAYTCYQ